MLTLSKSTFSIIKYTPYFRYLPFFLHKYLPIKFHSNHILPPFQHNTFFPIRCNHLLYKNILINSYSTFYPNNSVPLTTQHKKIIFTTILLCFTYLIWYFLYYKNKPIIHEFIDFEIKRTLSKLLTNNPSIISFLSSEINKILTHPQLQEQLNIFIFEHFIQNNQIKKDIQSHFKTLITTYLSSNNAPIHISYIIKSFINSEYGKLKIKEILYEYMEHNGKEYLSDLLEMKIIQMLNDPDFKQYVYNEVNTELQKYLKQKDNIQYILECLKTEMKI